MEGMKGIKEEFEEYLERGFPEEIAVLKAVGHHFASGVPGVWREIESCIREIAWKRRNIIESVPEKYKDAIKELLACTRLIKYMDNLTLSWGWFNIALDIKTYTYFVTSQHPSLPYIIPYKVVTRGDFEFYTDFEFVVEKGELVMLRTNANPSANFEIIGLFITDDGWLLEVRRSERGLKAISTLEEILMEEGDEE